MIKTILYLVAGLYSDSDDACAPDLLLREAKVALS